MSYRIAFAAFVAASSVLAQNIPLASMDVPYNNIPYQVAAPGPRGPQQGINICNSTTEGPNSMCQTIFLNSIDDFCIWGPKQPNSLIANEEGNLVGWCTKPGRGTRIIPSDALHSVQFIQTRDYVQVTGRIDQTMINIAAGDTGGEEDPHGADGAGNPIGGLLYSNAFPSNNGNNGTFEQVQEWANFLGGDTFCIKACDQKGANAARLCEHIYDRIGCRYNMPADYEDGVFLKCKGDNQDPPGVYTGTDGKVSTYLQPPESLGPISTLPYQPKIPATSDCVTYNSADLYAAAARVAPNPNSTAIPSSTTAPSGSAGGGTRSGNALPSQTANQRSGGQKNVISAVVGLGAVMIGLTLFA